MKLAPLPHQKQILDDLSYKKKAIVFLPSGAGKTHTMVFDVVSKKPKTFLYLVHRNEVLLQSLNAFRQQLPEMKYGIINRDKKEYNEPYLFAMVQTLTYNDNIEKISKNIEYVVIDEFHHSAAPTYQKILDYLKPKYLYGLTATPERTDLQNISNIVDNIFVGNIDLKTGIEKNILVPFHYIGLRDNIDYSDIEWNGYKYNDMDLDKKLLVSERDKKVIQEYKKYLGSQNRLTVGFCNSVEHVRRMVDKFNEEGINAAGIDHTQDLKERNQIITDFRNGFYKVLFTRDILNEGIDFPECSGLMFLRPTYSKIIFLQQLGRGLRKKKGKTDVIIIDLVGNDRRAHKMRQWLHEIYPQYKTTGENTKPEYKMTVPYVTFDEEVVNHMDLLDTLKYCYSKDELDKNYFEVKKKLGRVPRYQDISNPRLSSISGSAYRRRRKNGWSKYLMSLGECKKIGTKYTKEDLYTNYFEVKKKLGRVPKYDEMSNKNITEINVATYEKYFGSWNNAIKEMGDMPNREVGKITNEELYQNYEMVRKKLNHSPKQADMNNIKISKYPIGHYRRFGNWTEFILKMRDVPTRRPPRVYTDQEMIKNYYSVKEKLGRQPNSSEMSNSKISSISHGCYYARFGTWNKFLKLIGENIKLFRG